MNQLLLLLVLLILIRRPQSLLLLLVHLFHTQMELLFLLMNLLSLLLVLLILVQRLELLPLLLLPPSGYGYSGSLNMNTRLVNYPNGAKVPADEPAVAAARAAHLSARAGAAASAPTAASGYGYSGPLNMNSRLVDYPNGAKVPADEPAVA